MKMRSLKLSAIIVVAGTMLQFGGCIGGGIGRAAFGILDEIAFNWIVSPLVGADPLGLAAAATP